MRVNYKEIGGELEVTLVFDAQEITCLKHNLPGIQGIVDWYSKGPSSEKIFRCKERMCNECIPKLRAKGVAIPADDTELLDLITKDVDYQDREARNSVEFNQ